MNYCPNYRLSTILTPELIQYVLDITFPWPLESQLDGAEVGEVFFRKDVSHLWGVSKIKSALLSLSKIRIDLQDLILLLGSPSKTSFLHNAVGVILILDQAPRYLCKGIHARYIYDYFGVLARDLTSYLLSFIRDQNPFNIQTWLDTGFELSHAFLRISMLLAPLCHSDDPADHKLHLELTEIVRTVYEKETGTKDPHRATFDQDTKNIYIFADILDAGPPQGEKGTVRIEEFVYWIMRYFTAHVAYVNWFGRSPFRNCAVGRNDKEGEEKWLRYCGVEGDEAVREKVRNDVERGTWDGNSDYRGGLVSEVKLEGLDRGESRLMSLYLTALLLSPEIQALRYFTTLTVFT